MLCHDITRIVPGVTKDAVFRKGHIIREEDIPMLLSVGKEHVYIWENHAGMLHENEAADILRGLCQGVHMHASSPKEGKIELTAETDGLLLVDTERLRAVNALGDMMIATRASGFPVRAGDKLCGTRVIPLVIEKEKMERAVQTAGSEPLLRLLPFRARPFGVVTTGSEVITAGSRTHSPLFWCAKWQSMAVRCAPTRFVMMILRRSRMPSAAWRRTAPNSSCARAA